MARNPNIYQRDSTLLCDRFWEAVCLDYDDFEDDASVCCNDEYTFPADRGLDAFNRICTMSRPTFGKDLDEDPDASRQSPLTPRDFITSYFGTALGTPIPSSPVDFGPERRPTPNADRLLAHDVYRPSSPKRTHLNLRSPRPTTPLVYVSTEPCSSYSDVLPPAPPPIQTSNIRPMSTQEDVSPIVESDVMVQFVEGGGWTDLKLENENVWRDDESPVIPMVDTPTIDVSLYAARMAHWARERLWYSESLDMSTSNNLNWYSQSFQGNELYGPLDMHGLARGVYAT